MEKYDGKMICHVKITIVKAFTWAHIPQFCVAGYISHDWKEMSNVLLAYDNQP